MTPSEKKAREEAGIIARGIVRMHHKLSELYPCLENDITEALLDASVHGFKKQDDALDRAKAEAASDLDDFMSNDY